RRRIRQVERFQGNRGLGLPAPTSSYYLPPHHWTTPQLNHPVARTGNQRPTIARRNLQDCHQNPLAQAWWANGQDQAILRTSKFGLSLLQKPFAPEKGQIPSVFFPSYINIPPTFPAWCPPCRIGLWKQRPIPFSA